MPVVVGCEVCWSLPGPERSAYLVKRGHGHPGIVLVIGGRWHRECFLERSKLGSECWQGSILPGESKKEFQELSDKHG